VCLSPQGDRHFFWEKINNVRRIATKGIKMKRMIRNELPLMEQKLNEIKLFENPYRFAEAEEHTNGQENITILTRKTNYSLSDLCGL
jgi:hypothetical protein